MYQTLFFNCIACRRPATANPHKLRPTNYRPITQLPRRAVSR